MAEDLLTVKVDRPVDSSWYEGYTQALRSVAKVLAEREKVASDPAEKLALRRIRFEIAYVLDTDPGPRRWSTFPPPMSIGEFVLHLAKGDELEVTTYATEREAVLAALEADMTRWSSAQVLSDTMECTYWRLSEEAVKAGSEHELWPEIERWLRTREDTLERLGIKERVRIAGVDIKGAKSATWSSD